jgi:hypothetical protein
MFYVRYMTVGPTAPTLIVWVFSAAEEVPEAVSSDVDVGVSDASDIV